MADVNALMAERYEGEWWIRRATQPEPEPVGPSLPGPAEAAHETWLARKRLSELGKAAREFDHRHRLNEHTERITG